MGCISSKEAQRDRRLNNDPIPHIRCRSMPHYSMGPTNSYSVGPTSSLRLNSMKENETMMKLCNDNHTANTREAVDRAKAWSEMMDNRIPKSKPKKECSQIPKSEPETINTWELMQGLEEPAIDITSRASSVVSDFYPQVVLNFQKAPDDISPDSQSQLLRSPPEPSTDPRNTGIVKSRIMAFEQNIEAMKWKKSPPNGEKKVVIYLTSLRGVRKTFEECWSIKMILQGYGVKIDERDVSIHGGFKEEVREILGGGGVFKGNSLPRVFANGKYLGGAEEVRGMHEVGELNRVLEECEVRRGLVGICEGCGDMRFLICEKCRGSCKVFIGEGEEEQEYEVGLGFRRCKACNENGLVRCHVCL